MLAKTFALLNYRSINGKVTIFTANRKPEDSDICINHRQIASRILGESAIVNFSKKKDLRLN
jgi:hypothetical protein